MIIVFGPPAVAWQGQLVCVVAGTSSEIAKVKPLTTGVVGRATIDLPDQEPGKATTLKIIGNSLIGAVIESLAEAHTLAEKTGLGSDNLHKFCKDVLQGPFALYSDRMVSGEYYKCEEV